MIVNKIASTLLEALFAVAMLVINATQIRGLVLVYLLQITFFNLVLGDVYGIFCYIDINECVANTDGCDQGCQNTIGSFQCTCDSGYVLSNDERTCSG